MVDNERWSAPSLEQAVELAGGDLPREFQSWDEVPGWQGQLLPTPRVSMHHGPSEAEIAAGDPKTRLETAVAVHLLPTPTVQAAKHAEPTEFERQRARDGGPDACNLWVVVPMLVGGDPTDPPSNDGSD